MMTLKTRAGLATPVMRATMSKWTVWVGGSEVSLCYLSQIQAQNMAQAWKDKGYDDVVVEEVTL